MIAVQQQAETMNDRLRKRAAFDKLEETGQSQGNDESAPGGLMPATSTVGEMVVDSRTTTNMSILWPEKSKDTATGKSGDLASKGMVVKAVTDGSGLKDHFGELIKKAIVEPQNRQGATERMPSHLSAFASLRFGKEHAMNGVTVTEAAAELKEKLKAHGKSLEIINMTAGGDITETVTEG